MPLPREGSTEAPPAFVYVSYAQGVYESANGKYLRSGFLNGKPLWTHESSSAWTFGQRTDGYWALFNDDCTKFSTTLNHGGENPPTAWWDKGQQEQEVRVGPAQKHRPLRVKHNSDTEFLRFCHIANIQHSILHYHDFNCSTLRQRRLTDLHIFSNILIDQFPLCLCRHFRLSFCVVFEMTGEIGAEQLEDICSLIFE